jgi:hypothetical protein
VQVFVALDHLVTQVVRRHRVVFSIPKASLSSSWWRAAQRGQVPFLTCYRAIGGVGPLIRGKANLKICSR